MRRFPAFAPAAAALLLPAMLFAQTAAPQSVSGESSGPSIDERVSYVETWLTRLERTGISGYVQSRAVYQIDAAPSTNLFVRRARLNVRHSFDRGRLALSFDGGQNTVTVNDAYMDINLGRNRGQRQGVVLRAGQFFRPFGFEIERNESEREFPERPAGWGVFFPGNRDQGFDLSLGLSPATIANVAVVNGGGTSTSSLSFRDADDHKDVMLRVRQTLFRPRIDLALSYYAGRQTLPGSAKQAAQLGFVDENGNGAQDAGEATVIVSPARVAKPAIEGDRDRWGFALNAYDLLGGTLRGEYIGANDLTTNLGTGPSQGTAKAVTYYAMYLRYLAGGATVGARFDAFDPDVDDALRVRGDGEQTTIGLLAMRPVGDNVRFSLAWERPRVTIYEKSSQTVRHTQDPVWTLQALYKF